MKPLIGALIFFISLLLVVDIFEQLEYFIKFSDRIPVNELIYYYLYKIPMTFQLIFPIAVLFSIIFMLGNLNRNNELMAIFNAGIPLYRLLAPIFIFIFIISMILFIFNDKLIYYPNYKYQMLHKKFRFIKNEKTTEREELTIFGKNNKIYFIRSYYPVNKTMTNINILFLNQNNSIKELYSCESLAFNFNEKYWLAKNMYIRKWQDNRLKNVEYFKEKNLFLDEKPYHFEDEDKHIENMSIQESYIFAKKIEDIGGNYNKIYTDYYAKTAMPFIALIILFFGAPLSMYSRKSVLVISFALSVLSALLFFVLIYVGTSLGHSNQLPPFIAGWLGNIIFFIIGLILFKKMQI